MNRHSIWSDWAQPDAELDGDSNSMSLRAFSVVASLTTLLGCASACDGSGDASATDTDVGGAGGGAAATGGTGAGTGGSPVAPAFSCPEAAPVETACPEIFAGPGTQVGPLGLIPQPVSTQLGYGSLQLDAASRIVVDPAFEAMATALAEPLRRSTGLPLPLDHECGGGHDIVLRQVNEASLGDEEYRLEVGCGRVEIQARTEAGLHWGAETLRQLLPAEAQSPQQAAGVDWAVPHVRLTDRPTYAWRGFMLDVARNYFDKTEILRLIELASFHKLNRLHLHLTDDQGWRIQIDSWPKLTSVGATSEVSSGVGGFYSKADFAEIVAFARARSIVVVPEIDLPGHTNAALAAYPAELSESGAAPRAWPYRGTEVGFSSLWLGGPDTLDFVEDVVAELAEITPGPYLHVGGDEALASDPDEYATFLRDVEAIVRDHGKILVGWAESARAGLDPSSLAQHWHDDHGDAAQAAVAAGQLLIMSPAQRAYLDMKYDEDTPVGQDWAGLVSVQDAYGWNPERVGVPANRVLGIETALWTETVASRADIDLLAFPRLAGHAEVGWSPAAGRSWSEYRERLALHGRRLRAWPVGFYEAPEVDWPAP
ncbi:MAG TPA: beta-N-acetylhexosaminidase [Polyangiaceae bacterium]|nr:beta-N-acetylhexosaminidase [Polyangiaceae bacterium]